MAKKLKHNGFSLTEVLMAVGILSIGMMLIATMFPVGIYLTGVGVERTMASIIYDEAVAKIRLYGLPGLPSGTGDYETQLGTANIDPCEFSYPSVDPCTTNPQYYWSALYKQLSGNEYQITVFVARKTSSNLTYKSKFYNRPRVIDVNVQDVLGKSNELNVFDGNEAYVNSSATIFDTKTAQLYRVIERVGNVITLDRDWDANAPQKRPIWLVPPPDTGGRNADIEVYQGTMKF